MLSRSAQRLAEKGGEAWHLRCVGFMLTPHTPDAPLMHHTMSNCNVSLAACACHAGSKLYILNGNFKCDKEAGCSASDATTPLVLLRQVAATFDAGSS